MVCERQQQHLGRVASTEIVSSPGKSQKPPTRPQTTTRLLIYPANVRLKATAMPRATDRLDSLVQCSGGYLSAASRTHADSEWW